MSLLNELAILGDSTKALAVAGAQTLTRITWMPQGMSGRSNVGGSGYVGNRGMIGAVQAGSGKSYRAQIGDPLSNTVVAACVNAVAGALPKAPAYLEELATDKDGVESWVKRTSHPALDMLNQPNPHLSSADCWAATCGWEMTRGHAYWVALMNTARTQVTELWPWNPDRVTVLSDSENFISGYEIMSESGAPVIVSDKQVIQFRHAPHPDNLRVGWTPLSTGERQMAGDNAAASYHTAILMNAGVMSLLISIKDGKETSVSPEDFDVFLGALRRKYVSNKDSAGGIDGLSVPLDVQKMAYSPDEMSIDKLIDYYEGRLHSLCGVSRKVTDMGQDPTYLNMAEALKDFWGRRIMEMRARHAATLTTQYLPLFGLDPTKWRVGFDFSGIEALQEGADGLHARWRQNFKVGGIDLYTFQQKIGLPDVPKMYKGHFVSGDFTAHEPASSDAKEISFP